MDNKRFNDDIGFIARFYRKGSFVASLRFGDASSSLRVRRIRRWTAAAAAAVVLVAAGAVVYNMRTLHEGAAPTVEQKANDAPAAQQPGAIRRIEFNDVPLSVVAAEVERVYGVRLGNLPQPDRRITISYQGTAADFVESVNELTGSHITIVSGTDGEAAGKTDGKGSGAPAAEK